MSSISPLNLTHRQRVLILYKTILRLHRSLPPELAELGNRYVREEFHKHKKASIEFIGPFMVEWSRYAVEMTEQIKRFPKQSTITRSPPIGKTLPNSQLDHFSESQLNQLLTLAKDLFDQETASTK